MPQASGSAQIDASPYYRAVLSHMRDIQEPPFLTYRTTVPGGTGALVVSRGDDGTAELAIVAGASRPQSWDVAYRGSDGIASIGLPEGGHLIATTAIFDPTWRGAFAWLRRGIGASAWTPVVPTPTQSPTAPAASAPPLLAIVTAIDERAYDVSDGGEGRCADGSAGRRLWMHAKADPIAHPLTEAMVDEATMRFCAMRFHEHLPSVSVTLDLDVDLHFGSVGAYYLITDGSVDGAVRPYRRPGWFTFQTAFRYDRFAFPASLPPALFAPESRSR